MPIQTRCRRDSECRACRFFVCFSAARTARAAPTTAAAATGAAACRAQRLMMSNASPRVAPRERGTSSPDAAPACPEVCACFDLIRSCCVLPCFVPAAATRQSRCLLRMFTQSCLAEYSTSGGPCIACAAGKYQNATGRTSCLSCPAGRECDPVTGRRTPCRLGYFCAQGQPPVPCADGWMPLQTGQSEMTCGGQES